MESFTADFFAIFLQKKRQNVAFGREKTIKICQNLHADFLRLLFAEEFLKIKKELELVSRAHVFLQSFNKKLYFVI